MTPIKMIKDRVFKLIIAVFLISVIWLRLYNRRYFPATIERVALVMAHPDDEIMFFGPAVLKIIQKVGKDNFYILCMTNGNYYNLGRTREKELQNSGRRLGILKENIIQLNNKDFQDDLEEGWKDLDLVAGAISQILSEHDIDTILTFGEYGVSRHKNHISVYSSIQKLSQYRRLHLGDVSTFRKYMSFLDAFYTIFVEKLFDTEDIICLSSISEIYRVFRAMECHKSQFDFHDKLQFLLSRYIILNTLKVVDSSKKKTAKTITTL